MPKMKSHSGMKKRLKKTGGGKFKFKPAGARHRAIGNTNSNKRSKRALQILDKSFEKTIHKLLPYV